MADLGLPYDKHTPQVAGRINEKRMARDRGARLHPNSGAGNVKDDASDEDNLYEFKTANKTYTLKSLELRTLLTRAARVDKEARFVIEFADGITADITITRRSLG